MPSKKTAASAAPATTDVVITNADGLLVTVPVSKKQKKDLLRQMVQGPRVSGPSTVPGPPKGKKRKADDDNEKKNASKKKSRGEPLYGLSRASPATPAAALLGENKIKKEEEVVVKEEEDNE
ncbi:hypothetical protein VP1G_10469 [Cytospora mali]|nr:hypothetical protein VP1G_10469 [Valsa mali var. pyri (nom. inval.)]